MLTLDHLTVIAPSLKAGVEHVRACLGIDMPYGGAHPEMGTHNHLLRLGTDVFLEVIATDPHARPPAGPHWFGLDDLYAIQSAWDEGRRLGGWVARTADLDPVLAVHGDLLGRKTGVSRGDRSWSFSVRDDGLLPAEGAAPCVIAWGDRGCPASAMPDFGALLVGFAIEHPDPAQILDLYTRLGVENPPEVHKGQRIRLRAVIDTPSGIKELS
jgi:hypothetical protein